MTRDQIRARLNDRDALIATLLGEAAAEPIEGQIAVACVIRNRALHPRWWGTGYAGVCLKQLQFSCFWEDNANSDRVYALAEHLLERRPLGGGVLPQLAWIAEGIIGDQILDRTKGADHYLTTRLLESGHAPAWADATPVAVIASHTFFRLEI
jgi:hypothetical protein